MEHLTQSKEDYLEAILMIRNQRGCCQAIDIARHLSFSKPSVSVAVKNLERGGYILRNGNDICLTEIGQEVASAVLERHLLLSEILISLGVDEDVAAQDACKLEHCISDESYRIVKQTWRSRNHVLSSPA